MVDLDFGEIILKCDYSGSGGSGPPAPRYSAFGYIHFVGGGVSSAHTGSINCLHSLP